MPQPPTVTPRFSQAILQAATRLGVSLPAALHEALAPELLPERMPLAAQDQLWAALSEASGDPLIGLRVGLEIQVGHLDSVGLLLMSCDTLGGALEALLEYFPIISEGSHFETEPLPDGLRLHYRPGFDTLVEIRAEAVLGCLVHLSRWMTGHQFAPTELGFRHAARADMTRYRALLDCPLEFGQASYYLVYRSADLDIPLIQANAAMREHLRGVADSMLANLHSDSASLAHKVGALVRAHPDWGKERVAEQLGLSGRHLNRRLAEEGSSFKLLRDATLLRMAEERLRGDQRIADIAEALGFSDESAFAKAFKRWAGVTPARFRERGPAANDQT